MGLIQRSLQIMGTLITMPLVLHALGHKDFGLWAAAVSMVWMANLADLGLGNALLTAITLESTHDNKNKMKLYSTASLYLACVLSLFVGALTLISVRFLTSSSTRDVYQIASLALAINIPASLAGALWSGLQRVYMVWVWEAIQTVLAVIIMLLLTKTTLNVRFYVFTTMGTLLICNYGSLIHVLVKHPELRPGRINGRNLIDMWRKLISKSTPYFLLGLSATLSVSSDNIIALSILGPEAAARMAILQRAGMSAYSLIWSITQSLWPAYADAAERGDHAWIRRHLISGMALVILCLLVGCSVLIIFGQRMLEIWLGESLKFNSEMLWAMAAWIAVPALGRIPDLLLNALEVIWFQVLVALIYSCIAFILKLHLASSFGIAGIMMATGIAYSITHLPAYFGWIINWIRRTTSIDRLSL